MPIGASQGGGHAGIARPAGAAPASNQDLQGCTAIPYAAPAAHAVARAQLAARAVARPTPPAVPGSSRGSAEDCRRRRAAQAAHSLSCALGNCYRRSCCRRLVCRHGGGRRRRARWHPRRCQGHAERQPARPQQPPWACCLVRQRLRLPPLLKLALSLVPRPPCCLPDRAVAARHAPIAPAPLLPCWQLAAPAPHSVTGWHQTRAAKQHPGLAGRARPRARRCCGAGW